MRSGRFRFLLSTSIKSFLKLSMPPMSLILSFFPFLLRSLINRLGIFGDDKSFAEFNNPEGNANLLSFFNKLPYFEKSPERHLFFTDHDWDGPYGVGSVVINNSISRNNPNPRQICSPFWASDIAGPQKGDIYHFSSFVGFVGSHPIRVKLMRNLLAYLENGKQLPVHLQFNNVFHPHESDAQKAVQRAEYLDIMHKSATVLCPRGAGLNSARFFRSDVHGPDTHSHIRRLRAPPGRRNQLGLIDITDL